MPHQYIDVTNTFLTWHGSPTGIQRVIQGVSKCAEKSGFKLAVFDPESRQWYSIPDTVMKSTFEPDLFVRSNRRLKSMLSAPSKAGSPSVKQKLIGPVKDLIRPLYKQAALRAGLWMGRQSRERTLKKKGSAIRFQKGDRIFVLDVNWSIPAYLPALAEEKKKQPGLEVIGFIYDLTPITHPQFVSEKKFIDEFKTWANGLVQVSSGILTDSRHAADEVIRVYHGSSNSDGRFNLQLPDDRSVTHLAPPKSVRFGSRIDEEIASSSNVPSASEIIQQIESCLLPLTPEQKKSISEGSGWALCVGTMHPRKNLEVQIEALEPLWKDRSIKMPLFWVGRKGAGVEALLSRIQETPWLRDNVIHLESAPDSLLWSLFRGAKFSLYTSWTEGFGLPVSESLQRGCPVIASSGGSIPEVAGELIDYFKPSEASALRSLILRYLSDESEYKRVLERAQRFKPFSWEDTLEDFAELSNRAADR